MGPRRDWRGYPREEGVLMSLPLLQWGHAVIGVDTPEALGRHLRDDGASMGPRRDWRGYGYGAYVDINPVVGFNGATP